MTRGLLLPKIQACLQGLEGKQTGLSPSPCGPGPAQGGALHKQPGTTTHAPPGLSSLTHSSPFIPAPGRGGEGGQPPETHFSTHAQATTCGQTPCGHHAGRGRETDRQESLLPHPPGLLKSRFPAMLCCPAVNTVTWFLSLGDSLGLRPL